MTIENHPRDLKIINETCYNTEDLQDLMSKIYDTMVDPDLKSAIQNSGSHWYYAPRVAFDTLRVGYYNSKRVQSEASKQHGGHNLTFANMSARWTGSPRLGIVKKSKLYSSPLMAMAAQAEGGDGPQMPQEVVDCLIIKLMGAMGANSRLYFSDAFSEHFSWAKGFSVRYTERAKKGAAAKAGRERKRLALVKLQRKVTQNLSYIERVKIELKALIADSESNARKLEKLSQEMENFPAEG